MRIAMSYEWQNNSITHGRRHEWYCVLNWIWLRIVLVSVRMCRMFPDSRFTPFRWRADADAHAKSSNGWQGGLFGWVVWVETMPRPHTHMSQPLVTIIRSHCVQCHTTNGSQCKKNRREWKRIEKTFIVMPLGLLCYPREKANSSSSDL